MEVVGWKSTSCKRWPDLGYLRRRLCAARWHQSALCLAHFLQRAVRSGFRPPSSQRARRVATKTVERSPTCFNLVRGPPSSSWKENQRLLLLQSLWPGALCRGFELRFSSLGSLEIWWGQESGTEIRFLTFSELSTLYLHLCIYIVCLTPAIPQSFYK